MPISVVGNLKRGKGFTPPLRARAGFTLIELIIVLTILGVVAIVAFPKLEGAFSANYLRSSARRLAGMISYTKSQAALSGKEHRLYYDLERGEYWMAEKGEESFVETITELGRRRSLLEGVRFEKIITRSDGRTSYGIVSSRFSPRGWVEKTTIYLKNEKGEGLSILIKEPIGRIRILEEGRQ